MLHSARNVMLSQLLGFALLASSWMVEGGEYGLDCSYPILADHIVCEKTNEDTTASTNQTGRPLHDRQAHYDEYIQGCIEYYDEEECLNFEDGRIRQNRRQPISMVNFTETGFMKRKAPQEVQDLIRNFWETNHQEQYEEGWSYANIHTNHWKQPTYFLNIYDEELEGGGQPLADAIWDAARETIEEWTGMRQRPSSVYGIRVYKEGAVLAPHVDRFPLISSAIFNVAQDVDEDWPLEVYGRDGKAINVTMEPGDMVLYESGSLIHGRPFALKGRYYANIFIHFEPYEFVDGRPFVNQDDPELPPYVQAGSPEAERIHARDVDEGVDDDERDAHIAAADGDIEKLKDFSLDNNLVLNRRDSNGWLPIHEAAKYGHVDAVEFLVPFTRNINARTFFGTGDSPLGLALTNWPEDHPVVMYLESIGAEAIFGDWNYEDEDDEDEWEDDDEEEADEDDVDLRNDGEL